jgi:hypothetical protein
MLAAISRWFADRARRRERVAGAIRHFEVGGQRAIRGMCAAIAEETRGTIVRVCYGDTRPPRRSWFLVGKDGDVTELSWSETERLGERPWR